MQGAPSRSAMSNSSGPSGANSFARPYSMSVSSAANYRRRAHRRTRASTTSISPRPNGIVHMRKPSSKRGILAIGLWMGDGIVGVRGAASFYESASCSDSTLWARIRRLTDTHPRFHERLDFFVPINSRMTITSTGCRPTSISTVAGPLAETPGWLQCDHLGRRWPLVHRQPDVRHRFSRRRQSLHPFAGQRLG